MNLKEIKDSVVKCILGKDLVPRELLELHDYFRLNKAINFEFHEESGGIVAVSKDFRQGSIVTFGKNYKELDEKIKDAIMTSFDLPSVYKKEASIYNKNHNSKKEYVLV